MMINEIPRIERLGGPAVIEQDLAESLRIDYENSLRGWWPQPFADYFRERYRVDIAATYAGRPLAHPFGKGSGQLSMTPNQIHDSAEAGLSFVVLKTVIAEDSDGHASMKEWMTTDARMVVEPITGVSGRTGWTVSWKGRGWGRSLAEYLDFCKDAFEVMNATGMLVSPSAKFHLPAKRDDPWRVSEYRHVLDCLTTVWARLGVVGPMPIEKDFSPTLAGDDRGQNRESVERWLSEIVPLIKAATDSPLTVGLKLMNFVGDLDFQERLLRDGLAGGGGVRADYLVYANRLFHSSRYFEGHSGIAYGGPDLSDRNLGVLAKCRTAIRESGMEISGTGDVDSGRTAVEYALAGCSSVQIHTLFQTPIPLQTETTEGRLRRILARLILHPHDGLVAWLLHARSHWGVMDEAGLTRWMDLQNYDIHRQVSSD